MASGGWRRFCRTSAVLLLARTCTLCPQVMHAEGSATQVFAGPFDSKGGARLRVLSWNVAAVNNNPFEYWITHPSPSYKQLMQSVEDFIVQPGEDDVRVDQVFTDAMFRRLVEKMRAHMKDVSAPDLDTVSNMWESDYRGRRVVSQFLRDGVIGKKRLASMPDRVSNTIQLSSGKLAFRPTVINCYAGEIRSLDDWFEKWLAFFFEGGVDLDGKGPKPIHSLLQKIKQAKYPAITTEEEAVSIPLQLVLQGVFDAILVNLMQTKGGTSWQALRSEICVSLNSRKNSRLLEILQSTYSDADVVFLQEAGNQLVDELRQRFAGTHTLIVPARYNPKRNQNSVMLLRNTVVSSPQEVEVPADGWDAGDLLVVKAKVSNMDVTLASFHGDTNGLLTVPMIRKVAEHLPAEPLVFGLDANTYEKESSSTAHVLEFERVHKSLGFESCWGKVDPSRYTTFNARTYLQPQLNKAAKSNELAEKGDRNPKDFVLFSKHFEVASVWRDNTGRGEYMEETVFPTLEFPSDHAALSADLRFLLNYRREL